ncbi:hypothetical protein HAX54_027260 [Datura stramonium]|uniref:Tudor domain-containing protein n=1 Tax=Datura stramonium TaxID=4076 RepID=A0ABS8V497_DATST|nr:hypothetical protein [Datura stramonium]
MFQVNRDREETGGVLKPKAFLGRYVRKEFKGSGIYLGKIIFYDTGLYKVVYEDGDCEDMDSSEVKAVLFEDGELNGQWLDRKKKLDKLVASTEGNGIKSRVVYPADKLMVDLSDDYMEQDLSSAAEVPLFPAPQLPPSSDSIDFVGALNCSAPNTLFDSVHVALMYALRRHLKKLSSDGSVLASKCLRDIDWALALIQRLGRCIWFKEYYLLSAGRKIMVLQILCDNVLDSEELRAEIDMREESEIGMESDISTGVASVTAPRIVHPRYAKTALPVSIVLPCKVHWVSQDAYIPEGAWYLQSFACVEGLAWLDSIFRYYNKNDIPRVLQALNANAQHTTLYMEICKGIMQYWKIPGNVSFPDGELSEIGSDRPNGTKCGSYSTLSLNSLNREVLRENTGSCVTAEFQFRRCFYKSFHPEQTQQGDTKLVEIATCTSKKQQQLCGTRCLLNAAVSNAIKGAVKILAGLRSASVEEGNLLVLPYIILMEESLTGLTVGPFLSTAFRKQWRKQAEEATSCTVIKSLLLEFEENIRFVVFLGTGLSLSMVGHLNLYHSFNCWCCEMSHKHKPGRRAETIVNGGLRKIPGIYYAEGSKTAKRSRQLVWRAAVNVCKTISQLALQVRYLDMHVRWSDLVSPEQQSLLEGKGPESEASSFRNASICHKRIVGNEKRDGNDKHCCASCEVDVLLRNAVKLQYMPRSMSQTVYN